MIEAAIDNESLKICTSDNHEPIDLIQENMSLYSLLVDDQIVKSIIKTAKKGLQCKRVV